MPIDEMKQRRVRKFHCTDCREVFKGWKAIVAHTTSTHGRQPYVDKHGRYPDSATERSAKALAAMNDGLMLAC